MAPAHALVALGAAFLITGLLARAGVRIGLPTIPLFILAGILLGPNTPGVALFSRPADLELLAALGLVLLLFYIGLEFSFDELVDGGRRLALVGAVYVALNVGGGLCFGLVLGWGFAEALVLAGVIGVSSSAIVSKLLIELGLLGAPEGRLIFGIILVDDLFLAVYLALLSPVIGGAEGAPEIVGSIAISFAFLAALVSIGRWGAGWAAKVIDGPDDELLIVCFTGLAVLTAGLAEELGIPHAIGALMVGLILGSTPLAERIKRLVHPLRDAFGALFFFSFGLAISPADVMAVAAPILAAVVLTVVMNLVSGAIAARIHGLVSPAAARIGFTVLARGEFALVLAALATAANLDPRLTGFVAGYVLVLAVIGPLAANRAARPKAVTSCRRSPRVLRVGVAGGR